MRFAVVAVALGGVVVGFTAGCSSSGPSAAEVMKVANDAAQAICNKRQSCTNGVNITRTFGDVNTCLQREALVYTLALQAPSTGASTTNTESCVTALATLSCPDFFANNLPGACLVTGPKAANAPCAFQGQCSTTYCDDNKTTSCGTCGDAPSAGASCRNSDCARGQECLDRTLTCYVPGTTGAACDPDTQPCTFGASCVTATGASMGTCTAETQELGVACGGAKGQCDQSKGLACEGPTGSRTCVAQPFAADGQACGLLANGAVLCEKGDCYNAAGTIALSTDVGTCKAQAADDQPCDIEHGPNCTLPSRCVTTGGGTAGVCTLPSGTTCE